MSPLETIISKNLLSPLFPHTSYFLWPLTVSRLDKKKRKKFLVALFRCKISTPFRNQGDCSDCRTFLDIIGVTCIHLRCTPVTCMLLVYFYMFLVVVGVQFWYCYLMARFHCEDDLWYSGTMGEVVCWDWGSTNS